MWKKIKMFFAGRKVLKEILKTREETKRAYEKSSWKSTEFWKAVFIGLGGIIAQAQGLIPQPYGSVALAISAAAYAIGRGMAKGPDPLGGMKTGVSTTEFWGTVMAQIATVAVAVSGTVSPEVAAVLAMVSQVAYSISRGLAKGGAQPEIE